MYEARAEQTVSKVLARRAAQFGDKSWVIADGRSYSYREADRLSNQLAHGLDASGVSAGETVLVMLPDGMEIILSWCGLGKLGAMEVQVNTHLRGAVLQHIVKDACAKRMIVHEMFLERLEQIIDDPGDLRELIICGSGRAALPPGIAERFSISRFESYFADNDAPLERDIRYHDLVAIMYTSGTTGPSKGVMITHAHAYEYALSCVESLELGEADVYYNPLPLFHIAGQWAAVYAACIAGATVVIPGSFSLTNFWGDVRKSKSTCSFLLGAMANWISRQPANESDADNPMQRMLVVPLLPEIEDFKQRFDVLVSTTWGSTEINCPTRSSFSLANNKTCGRVAPDRFEVMIANEFDEEQPPGVPGEALVRTKEPWIIMAGYWNNPEATAKAWRNQWMHTGDMLMKDEEGNLYFVDRTKDAIRRRGENISSMEVENEINVHPAVVECAVVPVAAEDSEQEVLAVLVLQHDAELDPAELIAFLEPRMAHFMVPRYIDIISELPKTQTGKIQKFPLRERGLTSNTWDREAAGIKLRK